MCIYYIIHTLTNKSNAENNGAKNCRTFLFGSVIYIILYMVLMHFSLKNPFSYDIFKTGLILLIGADIATMAYIYKSYYGRFIINEFDENNDNWKFNKDTHNYKKKTDSDYMIEKEINNLKTDIYQTEINKLKQHLEKK